MQIRPFLLVALATLMALMSAAARADIYGYIDEKGEGHFSTEKLDEHYQLFQRSGQVFDSTKLAQPLSEAESAKLSQYLMQHPNLKKYEALVNQAAQEFEVEPALLEAVMAAESGFNPTAISPKGAIGLMQVMPATAERYGLQSDRRHSVQQKLIDPKTNIWLAARYLSDLGKLFVDRLDLVAASYNAGERAVQKYNNTIPPYPETRNYVDIVTRIYKLYKPSAGNSTLASLTSVAGAPTRVYTIIPAHAHPIEQAPTPLPEISAEIQ